MSQKITAVLTENAPQPIGPYSQAIEANGMVFCSGQVALDPKSGQVVGTDVATQTHQVMKNVNAVLLAAGLDLSNVVKTTIFLKSMGDFPKVNEIYGGYITEANGIPPARSTVEVSRLPKDVLVEIEVLALR
jgi:2-iminobutanoate/2-iminopropanoate deaminase